MDSEAHREALGDLFVQVQPGCDSATSRSRGREAAEEGVYDPQEEIRIREERLNKMAEVREGCVEKLLRGERLVS